MSRRPCTFLLAALLCTLPACGGGGGGPGPAGLPVLGRAGVQAYVETLVGTTATAFQFRGQASDIEGGAVGYAWDFDGDGTTDDTTQAPVFTFATSGARTVRLKATDGAGRTTSADLAVNVAGAAVPTTPSVALRVWILHGEAPAQVYARAYAEDPDGGAITTYAFDFDGDGTNDVVSTSPTAVFTLPTAGVFEARVTVTDDETETASAGATIVLCATGYPEQGPSCQIVEPAGETSWPTATPIPLLAAGADLDGGALAAIAWDLDDDGVFDDATGREVDATFAAEGVHRVRVRLTDDEGGAPSEAEIRLLIDDGAATGAPSALASAEALVVAPGQSLQFHARGVDPDGDALVYAWDFDSDGVTDATAADAIFSFAVPGVYRPRVTVSDGLGGLSASDLTVLVEACTAASPNPFRHGHADLEMLRGGTASVRLMPLRASSAPLRVRIHHKAGPPGDFGALDLAVRDEQMNAVPPTTPDIAVPIDGIVPIEIESLALGGSGAPVAVYTADVRIEDPGVRIQVVPVQVRIADPVRAELFLSSTNPVFTDQYAAALQVVVDAAATAAPSIHGVALTFADMTPVWQQLFLRGSAFLPFGWGEAADANMLRFTTSTSPIPLGGLGLTFQFGFDTDTAGAGVGPLPTAGEVAIEDATGRRIGRVGMVVTGP